MRRILLSSSAFLWGLQFAFLNPSLALLLVALYDAGPGEVGWVLAVYNLSGFVCSLVVPWWADRRHDYLHPMLACAVLTVALAVVLGLTSSLPLAVVGLVMLGGPAGVGMPMLFAHLRHSGASRSEVVTTRAYVSFAWVAGPPLAGFIIAGFGNRAVLVAIAAIAVLSTATTLRLLHAPSVLSHGSGAGPDRARGSVSNRAVGVILLAFVALNAANSAAVSVTSLFVTRSMHLPIVWAGTALGVGAVLEIPALLLLARAGAYVSDLGLLASGCAAGIAYYAAMAHVTGPAQLVAVQVLNAWLCAMVAGVGLSLFQRVIPRPGLASGLYTNTRRVGAIVSGPVIGLGSAGAEGFRPVFVVCAAITLAALAALGLVGSPLRGDWWRP